MYSAAIWRLPLQPNDFKLKAINGSNSRTIQTKFHIENERSPPKHQKRSFEDIEAVLFGVLLISFRYCFDQKFETNGEPKKPL
jgi:hypothetical protein